LRRYRLQPRQQLKAEQPAKGERHLALAVAVHVLPLDLHFGVVAQHALDHRGDFRGRATSQTRVDAYRAALDVPVDHHAAAAVTGVPFGHEV
jgi:ABC-type sulfate transport system permease subunit